MKNQPSRTTEALNMSSRKAYKKERASVGEGVESHGKRKLEKVSKSTIRIQLSQPQLALSCKLFDAVGGVSMNKSYSAICQALFDSFLIQMQKAKTLPSMTNTEAIIFLQARRSAQLDLGMLEDLSLAEQVSDTPEEVARINLFEKAQKELIQQETNDDLDEFERLGQETQE